MTDESRYVTLRDQLVEEMIEFRSATHERDLLARMVASHELVQRQVSRNLDPIQLDLLGGDT
jgi:hypothetical protein